MCPLTLRTRRSAPIVATKTDAALTIGHTGSGVWADTDTGGNAAARPLDLVVPGVRAGQRITLSILAHYTTGTNGGVMDFWSVVGGAPVSHIGQGAPNGPWIFEGGKAGMVSGRATFTVQEADIENGSVRLRLRHSLPTAGGTLHTLFAGFGFEIRLEADHPKG